MSENYNNEPLSKVSFLQCVDAIMFGIGHTEENSTLVALNLTAGLSGRELYGDSVGDILFHFYDHRGQFSMPWLSERVVRASQKDFMNVE